MARSNIVDKTIYKRVWLLPKEQKLYKATNEQVNVQFNT